MGEREALPHLDQTGLLLPYFLLASLSMKRIAPPTNKMIAVPKSPPAKGSRFSLSVHPEMKTMKVDNPANMIAHVTAATPFPQCPLIARPIWLPMKPKAFASRLPMAGHPPKKVMVAMIAIRPHAKKPKTSPISREKNIPTTERAIQSTFQCLDRNSPRVFMSSSLFDVAGGVDVGDDGVLVGGDESAPEEDAPPAGGSSSVLPLFLGFGSLILSRPPIF